MARILRVPKRRRAEGKTDYKARLGLLKSGKPRLVIRKTNRYIIAQIVTSEQAQDKTLVRVSSKDISGFKPGQGKSRKAAYETGKALAGKAGDVKEVIVDFGLHRVPAGGRLMSVVQGAVEAGLNIPHNPGALPSTGDKTKKEQEDRE
ncbi:50S ribosomal protein L18 [Candidatus Pacearchaeota archaeon]|nr:50S ribosomal protein L18 [Candidatus Pacearchaeota archaeon]|tara:strand:- start:294 stop:737 length:444 start_codon:yes stop_codon:yes gene_type:complete